MVSNTPLFEGDEGAIENIMEAGSETRAPIEVENPTEADRAATQPEVGAGSERFQELTKADDNVAKAAHSLEGNLQESIKTDIEDAVKAKDSSDAGEAGENAVESDNIATKHSTLEHDSQEHVKSDETPKVEKPGSQPNKSSANDETPEGNSGNGHVEGNTEPEGATKLVAVADLERLEAQINRFEALVDRLAVMFNQASMNSSASSVITEPKDAENNAHEDGNGNPVDDNGTAAAQTATYMGLPGLTLNPDFDAYPRGPAYNHEAAVATLNADIERGDDDLDQMCTACDKPGAMKCGKCQHAWYCSKGCQVSDWPLHKKVCSDFASHAADGNRPGPEYQRVLYFPTHLDKPQLHWATYHETDDGLWVKFVHDDIPQFEKEAIEANLPVDRKNVVLNLWDPPSDRRVGHRLTAIAYPSYDHAVEVIPKFLNRSINHLVRPGYCCLWFGPVVVFVDRRKYGEKAVRDSMGGITARDVHSIMRFMELGACDCVAVPARYAGELIHGLRINDVKSDIAVAMDLPSRVEETMVPLSPICHPDYPIAMAFHLGLRWYIRAASVTSDTYNLSDWKDNALYYVGFVCTFREATTTKPIADGDTAPDSNSDTIPDTDTGAAPTPAPNPTSTPAPAPAPAPAPTPEAETVFHYGPFAGSVIILHGSGNPVLPCHVLTLHNYLMAMHAAGGVASKAGFQKFWNDVKCKAGKPLASVPSPYKWEKNKSLYKDKLGIVDPEVVRQRVSREIDRVWGFLISRGLARGDEAYFPSEW